MQRLNANLIWAGALIDELVRSGVVHFFVSPGSRSAPLALSAAAHPEVCDRSLLDERAAAFFALGLARSTRRPVALICTSGTAAANYLPAVIEAHYGHVPLILLSADRPAEQRACGAGQTIDQTKLYGDYVRFFAELPAPRMERQALLHLRRVACRAVAEAGAGPPGPVHLNLPFREPLDPRRSDADLAAHAKLDRLAREGRAPEPITRVARPAPLAPTGPTLERLAARIRTHARGWIVVGPLEAPEGLGDAVAALARTAGWPILADPLSQIRCGPHDRSLLVDAYDSTLQATEFVGQNAPDLVLRFGAMPTSKAYRLLLEGRPEIEQLVIDPWSWSDPTGLVRELIRADPLTLARALQTALSADTESSAPAGPGVRAADTAERHAFAARWVEAGRRARRVLSEAVVERAELTQPATVCGIDRIAPPGTTLYVGNSLAIRELDRFLTSSARPLRVLANRGANGIDGTLACALGAAQGSGAPFLALIGDLALLHDWSAVIAASDAGIDATVVILDNDGGGIFELLPVATEAPREIFERHFATPQGIDLAAALHGFGLGCTDVRDPPELERALQSSLDAGGLHFIRVRLDRREHVELHRKLDAAVAAALDTSPHRDGDPPGARG